MGIGPQITCDKCGREFFGGKGYDRGQVNYCYECLVPMVDTITERQIERLGVTQKGFFNMVAKMGGLDALGGQEGAIKMLKTNAGEIDQTEDREDDENGMKFISDEELERLRPKNKFQWVQWEIGDLDTFDWKRQPFMFQCLRCNSHFTYKECANCGNTDFEASGSHGVFCTKCGEGFTSWPCKNCGTNNPAKKTRYILRNQGCFIATAAYGAEDAYEVELFRLFRDQKLMPTSPGKILVYLYYKISPTLSKPLQHSEFLRTAVRKLLLDPIANKLNTKL